MLKRKSLRFLIMSLVALGLSATFLGACSTPPKPKELVDLERVLQAPDALEVRDAPGSSKYYREARQYRRVARKAYEDGEMERAQEYAVLGTLRYRTAAAIKKQLEEKTRLDKANAQVAEVNPKIKALSQERNKLTQEVAGLKIRVSRANNSNSGMQGQANSNRGFDRNSDGSTGEMIAARNKINAAQKARDEALAVKADEYAANEYQRATKQLNAAVLLRSKKSSSPQNIGQAADDAADLFRKSAAVAKPKHEEFLAMQDPDARRSAIRNDAEETFGARFTQVEPLGVRVVMASAFDRGSWQLSGEGQTLAAAVAKLAEDYKEAKLVLEGYTRKGDPTENLGISASRARTVRKKLVAQGIDDSRISTSGLGQENPRFAGDASKNDRVEIIFRIP